MLLRPVLICCTALCPLPLLLGKRLMAWHKSNPVSQRLASVPGIGPIIATAIAATVVEPWRAATGQARKERDRGG